MMHTTSTKHLDERYDVPIAGRLLAGCRLSLYLHGGVFCNLQIEVNDVTHRLRATVGLKVFALFLRAIEILMGL